MGGENVSYTGVYGPMAALETGEAPRITDRERWERLEQDGVWGNIVHDADVSTIADDGYPRNEWDTVLGFRTWAKDVRTDYNIERLAFNYSRDDFRSFWGAVGEAIEPFRFIHSGESGHWPTVEHYDLEDESPEYVGRVFRVTVDGGVTVERGTVEFTGFEVVEP